MVLDHGSFPITAWEDHVVRLDNWCGCSVSKLAGLVLLHWRCDWLNGRIWGSNCNWKVGAVSISHYWVAVISWGVWFFIVVWVFFFNFFDQVWSRSFIEKILTGEPSSFRFNSETIVFSADLVVSGVKNVLNFLVNKTLIILFEGVEVEDWRLIIVSFMEAHLVDKVNWW